MSIVFIDATTDSITISWPENGGVEQSQKKSNGTNNNNNNATQYLLQYRPWKTEHDADDEGNSSIDDSNNTVASDEYVTLSKSLRTTLVRKNNLTDPNHAGFQFRLGIVPTIHNNIRDSDTRTWLSHAEPFYLLTEEQSSVRMLLPPSVTYGGTNASLRISWSPYDKYSLQTKQQHDQKESTTITDDTGTTNDVHYEVQMRENSGGMPWTTIVTEYKSTIVRKKNVASSLGYQFRIRPMQENNNATSPLPFSPNSSPMVALSYINCTGLQRHFASLTNQTLLSNLQSHTNNNNASPYRPISAPIAEAVGGKEYILLYVSAHWCGPCRQYTPKLISWYQQQVGIRTSNGNGNGSGTGTGGEPKNDSPIEIVFLSADHDRNSFQSYYSTMPWMAIDYDDPTREQFMSTLRVRGIPQLAVMDGRTGKIVDDNAVQKTLDVQRWRQLVAK
jgi:thiol-disulfide isomerase/thioredoxin